MLFFEPSHRHSTGAATMKYDNYSRRLTIRTARTVTAEPRRTRSSGSARRRRPRIMSRRAVARAS
jgi:hypothetical protein